LLQDCRLAFLFAGSAGWAAANKGETGSVSFSFNLLDGFKICRCCKALETNLEKPITGTSQACVGAVLSSKTNFKNNVVVISRDQAMYAIICFSF